MKRIVICCDGTWNSPDQFDRGKLRSTNVAKTAEAVVPRDANGTPQLVFYEKGVGTRLGERFLGGAFGYGLSRNIELAYRFLVENYELGDELFFFGFSRGAYTARSTVGLIRNSGLLQPKYAQQFDAAYALYRRRDDASHPSEVEARLFRKSYSREVPIHFIGVWDTVGALGIPHMPGWLPNRYWRFHDVNLSRTVANAFQALAIDEHRGPFIPSIWNQHPQAPETQVLEQAWFAGAHSNVGGGYEDAGLSDVAFEWMMEKAQGCGLAIDFDAIGEKIRPRPLGALRNSRKGLYLLRPPRKRRIDDEPSKTTNEHVAASALERMQALVPKYAPKNLLDYLRRKGGQGPATAKTSPAD